MLTSILSLIAGIALLAGGAEALVRSASALARRLGVTPLLVGLTIVAFGTSAPELVVSLNAALSGRGDIAAGNVIGSNIANVALILALAGLLRPLRIEAKLVALDIPLMIGASFVALLLLRDGRLGRAEGLALVVGLAAFVWLSVKLAARERTRVAEEFERGVPAPTRSAWVEVCAAVGGLVLLVVGADFLLRGAVSTARMLGLSEAVIGLTVVAIGTSLPELATSVVASYRGRADIAVGNVVGSNLFNILGILGVSALARPLATSGLRVGDLFVMVVAAAAVLPLARTGMRLSRWESAAMLAGYVVYVAFRIG